MEAVPPAHLIAPWFQQCSKHLTTNGWLGNPWIAMYETVIVKLNIANYAIFHNTYILPLNIHVAPFPVVTKRLHLKTHIT